MKGRECVKRLMLFSLFVFFILAGNPGLFAADTPPSEVINAAQKGICDFVNAERSTNLVAQNRSTILMAENGQLEYGFQVYTLTPKQLLMSSNVTSHLIPTGLWRFVVANNGNPISLITVAQVEGEWKAVALGGAQIAGEVSRVMNTWPAKDNYSYRFVRFFQARTDLMEIFRAGKSIGFVPLTASRLAFDIPGAFDPAVLLSEAEIFLPLKKIVNERMADLVDKNGSKQ